MAQRWKTDPEGEYAQGRRKELIKANSVVQQEDAVRYTGSPHTLTILSSQTGKCPTVVEAAAEFAVSNTKVQRALSKAGITLPAGCKR